MVSVDVYRPAARQQLSVIGSDIQLPVYEGIEGESRPAELARGARREAVQTGRDVVLIDTAGRLHIDEQLMVELQSLKELLSPTEILFVADAMTGQDAVKSADEFHKRLGITGVILTKMDGDARGGAALSIRHVTGQSVKFVGVGEKADALEPFYPERMASRILGMGDMKSLADKVQAAQEGSDRRAVAEKFLKGKFDFDDFLSQMKGIRKMGSMSKLLAMIPGAGDIDVDDSEFGRVEAMIQSMTASERRNPDLIDGSRRRRIAAGSGTSVSDVNRLLKEFAQARVLAKQMSGGRMPRMRLR